MAAAQQVLNQASRRLAASARQPADVQAQAEAARTAAETALQLEEASSAGEARGAEALDRVIGILRQAIGTSPETAGQVGAESVRQRLGEITVAASRRGTIWRS